MLVLAPMRVEEWMLRRGIPRESIERIGMGRKKSNAAIERLRDRDFDRLIIAGVCGSLDPSFRPGDVLLPTEVSAHDVPAIQCTVDPVLVDALRAAGLNVRTGTLVSTPKLESNKKAVRSHEGTGAVGVDMESAWLATLAGDRPVTVVRVASDSPDQPVFHPGVVYWGTLSLKRLARAGRVIGEWAASAG
ncbi:MAG: 4-hydroxy-3-methylbut-2-en-yl diphosphate reductase [Frankiales bacterium]|nr:4-hydroxy-3-methylbut-2-en-yl diphosphate reductase [Frankiales bacterium]